MSQKHILTTTRSDIMTDLEILKHAQEYITKLSQGINPLTEKSAAESDLIRNPKIQQYQDRNTLNGSSLCRFRTG